MTIRDWLAARSPAPPSPLYDRMLQLLGAREQASAADATRVLLDAARETLRSLLAERRFSRDGALDLLVADAFMTYAFEHAAGEKTTEHLDALALGAAAGIGQLATTHA